MEANTKATQKQLAIGKRIIGCLIRTEEYAAYEAERSNDFIGDAERADRCYKAAEFGMDGSTHQERIDDMRSFWNMKLRERRGNDVDRVDGAVYAYLADLEAWHLQNGTLFSEVV